MLDANQKKALKLLKETEASVLEVFTKVPHNILCSGRLLDIAKNHMLMGFMAAKEAVKRPEVK